MYAKVEKYVSDPDKLRIDVRPLDEDGEILITFDKFLDVSLLLKREEALALYRGLETALGLGSVAPDKTLKEQKAELDDDIPF